MLKRSGQASFPAAGGVTKVLQAVPWAVSPEVSKLKSKATCPVMELPSRISLMGISDKATPAADKSVPLFVHGVELTKQSSVGPEVRLLATAAIVFCHEAAVFKSVVKFFLARSAWKVKLA